jgi:hypothetical protein
VTPPPPPTHEEILTPPPLDSFDPADLPDAAVASEDVDLSLLALVADDLLADAPLAAAAVSAAVALVDGLAAVPLASAPAAPTMLRERLHRKALASLFSLSMMSKECNTGEFGGGGV